jgi:hypothetical protein
MLKLKSSDKILEHRDRNFLYSETIYSVVVDNFSLHKLFDFYFLPLYPTLNQMNADHTLMSYVFKLHFNIIAISIFRSPECSLPPDSNNKILYPFLYLSCTFDTYSLHSLHIHLDLFSLTIDSEDNIIWISSLYSFFPSSYHFLCLRSKYSPQHPVPKHTHLLSSLKFSDNVAL